jgi:flagellar basal-body rod protein FlgB
MEFGKLPLFSMLSERLTWLGKRQQVLAQNIANADTPGFRAQDVKSPDFKGMLRGGGPGTPRPSLAGPGAAAGLSATHVKHMTAPLGSSPTYKVVEDKSTDVSLSGNSVGLEEQVLKVTKTAMDHQLTVNLYRKHIAMIKMALGRPGV